MSILIVKMFPVHDTFAFVSLEDAAMTHGCVKKHTIDAKLFMNRQWRLRELRLRSKSCLVPLPQIQSSETEIAELSGSIARPPPGLTLTANAPVPKQSAVTSLKLSPAEKPTVVPTSMNLAEENNGDTHLDLHTQISGRAFSSKATQALNDITAAVIEKLSLNVDHVARDGSVGRGTVNGGATVAEIVFFLKDLPVAGQLKWLPALHKAVVGVLKEYLSASHGVEDVVAEADSVKFNVRGVVSVDMKFVPVFDSLAEVYQALKQNEADARRRLGCALLKERRTHFIAKQPGQVTVPKRLLKCGFALLPFRRHQSVRSRLSELQKPKLGKTGQWMWKHQTPLTVSKPRSRTTRAFPKISNA